MLTGHAGWLVGNMSTRLLLGSAVNRFASAMYRFPPPTATPAAAPMRISCAPTSASVKVLWPMTRRAACPLIYVVCAVQTLDIASASAHEEEREKCFMIREKPLI